MGAMIKRWLRRRSQPGSGAGGLGLPGPDEMPPGLPTPDAAPPGLDEVQPDLLAWAQALDVSRLSDRTFRQVEDFLRTYRHMNLGARQEQAWRLSGIPEVLLVTRGQPGAGPGGGGVQHLAGRAVAEEGMDLPQAPGPGDGGVGDVVLQGGPDSFDGVVVRAVTGAVDQL